MVAEGAYIHVQDFYSCQNDRSRFNLVAQVSLSLGTPG
jgi:hypothetical protein